MRGALATVGPRRRFQQGGSTDARYADSFGALSAPDDQNSDDQAAFVPAYLSPDMAANFARGSAPPDQEQQASSTPLGGITPDAAQRIAVTQQRLAQAKQAQDTLKSSGASVPPEIQALDGSPGPGGPPGAGGPPGSGAPPAPGGTGFFDPSQAPGATNLPMLAAAAAMLKPTHSGTFSEALGNAFSAAVPVAEQQRKIAEEAALRKAQMDQNKAIWGARVDVQKDRAATYANSVANRLAVQSRANDLKEQGLDEKAANDLATQELAQGKLDALVTHYGAMDDAARRRGDQGDRRLDQNDRRLGQTDTRIQQSAQRIQQTDEYHQAVLSLRAENGDNANTNALIARATQLAAGTGMSISKAMDQIKAQVQPARDAIQPLPRPRPGASPAGASPATAGSDVLGQARAAIAAGASRDAVIQRLQRMGVDPGGL